MPTKNTKTKARRTAKAVGSRRLVRRLLQLCRNAGYKRIAIHMAHKKVPCSMSWPFGNHGSIFAHPECDGRDGWPAIWRFPEKLGLTGGCGNGHQYQIDGLEVEGQTWELQKRKTTRWVRIA